MLSLWPLFRLATHRAGHSRPTPRNPRACLRYYFGLIFPYWHYGPDLHLLKPSITISRPPFLSIRHDGIVALLFTMMPIREHQLLEDSKIGLRGITRSVRTDGVFATAQSQWKSVRRGIPTRLQLMLAEIHPRHRHAGASTSCTFSFGSATSRRISRHSTSGSSRSDLPLCARMSKAK
jgi:hypothetical protein